MKTNRINFYSEDFNKTLRNIFSDKYYHLFMEMNYDKSEIIEAWKNCKTPVSFRAYFINDIKEVLKMREERN